MKVRYATEPTPIEVMAAGDKKAVFVRENITQIDDEYECDEFVAKVNANVEITASLVKMVKEKVIQEEAKAVRAKRNQLLAESDKEVLPDRLNKNSALFKAWSDYREALREIPEQEGFPFDVIFPEKPE